jgi:hypothetical protein
LLSFVSKYRIFLIYFFLDVFIQIEENINAFYFILEVIINNDFTNRERHVQTQKKKKSCILSKFIYIMGLYLSYKKWLLVSILITMVKPNLIY